MGLPEIPLRRAYCAACNFIQFVVTHIFVLSFRGLLLWNYFIFLVISHDKVLSLEGCV